MKKSASANVVELIEQAGIERAIAGECDRKVVSGWHEEKESRLMRARRLEDEAEQMMCLDGEVVVHPSGEARQLAAASGLGGGLPARGRQSMAKSAAECIVEQIPVRLEETATP